MLAAGDMCIGAIWTMMTSTSHPILTGAVMITSTSHHFPDQDTQTDSPDQEKGKEIITKETEKEKKK